MTKAVWRFDAMMLCKDTVMIPQYLFTDRLDKGRKKRRKTKPSIFQFPIATETTLNIILTYSLSIDYTYPYTFVRALASSVR